MNNKNIIMLTAFCLAVAFLISQSSGSKTNSAIKDSGLETQPSNLEQMTFNRINQERTNAGLPALAWNDKLAEMAELHSAYMAEKSTLSHDNFESRLKSTGLAGSAAAENAAKVWSPQKSDDESEIATTAVQQWMGSAGHKTNILGPYSKTGVGAYYDEQEGFYYFTQVFIS